MRLLVTGATGRVGSRLIPRLLTEGHTVRILTRNTTQTVPLQQIGTEIVKGELTQPDTLRQAVTNIEAVIHLAAFFRDTTEEEAYKVNVDGTRALANAALAVNVSQFVYISTSLVYGHGRGRPAQEDDEIYLPNHFYPATKYKAEQALSNLHIKDHLPLGILRLAFVYGEGDSHMAEVTQWVHMWPVEKRLHMVHHADVAQAIQLVLDQKVSNGRIYNVADNTPITTADILSLNGLTTTEAQQTVLEDPWEGIVDTSRIQNELGFNPIYNSFRDAQAAGTL